MAEFLRMMPDTGEEAWELDLVGGHSLVYSRMLLMKVGQMVRQTSSQGQPLIKQISWFADDGETSRQTKSQIRHGTYGAMSAEDATLRAMEATPDASLRMASLGSTPPKTEQPMRAAMDRRLKEEVREKPTEQIVAKGKSQHHEFEQLLCLLAMSPNGVMSYEYLLEYATEPLLYLLQDSASFWWWLQNNNDGSIEVFGQVGTGHPALRLAPLVSPLPVNHAFTRSSVDKLEPVFSYGPSGSPLRQPMVASPTASYKGFTEWSAFNPDAAEFKTFNPGAVEFKPLSTTLGCADLDISTSANTFPDPLKSPSKITEFTPFVSPPNNFFLPETNDGIIAPDLSDEEQAKLLGTQLIFDIGGFRSSPESARTSAGTEQETGEDETEAETILVG
jgi:hypothetical protein